tara:strand:+ start:257 stop:556 length:300 start_codon:yes stop_codon:yes gene_type:complete
MHKGVNMYFEPKNRHLLVLPLEEEEEKNKKFVLPEDYKKPKSPYVVCDVLGVSEDCDIENVNVGDTVVIERHMLLEIKAAGETNYLIQQNYIYGRLQNE